MYNECVKVIGWCVLQVDHGQRHILTACQDRNIRVYNVSSGKHSKTFKGSIGDDGTLIKVCRYLFIVCIVLKLKMNVGKTIGKHFKQTYYFCFSVVTFHNFTVAFPSSPPSGCAGPEWDLCSHQLYRQEYVYIWLLLWGMYGHHVRSFRAGDRPSFYRWWPPPHHRVRRWLHICLEVREVTYTTTSCWTLASDVKDVRLRRPPMGWMDGVKRSLNERWLCVIEVDGEQW